MVARAHSTGRKQLITSILFMAARKYECISECCSPSLVWFCLCVRSVVELRLEPLCTFNAVPLAQARQVLGSLCVFELIKMLFLVEIGVNLVKIARMASSLLLRVGTTYSRHI